MREAANIHPPLEILGPRIRLRKPRLADAPVLEEQVRRPEVTRWTTRIPHPYPPGGALRFLRSAARRWAQGRDFIYVLEPLENPVACGVVSLAQVSREHGCAELGFWLGSDYWGRGWMTEAVGLALEIAFTRLGLFRIYASCYADNSAARRVLEKNGFQLEGRLRQAVVKHGARRDYLLFGLLAPEYSRRAPEQSHEEAAKR
ncbi:MAG: hypothetical protein Kow00109_02760 [Acidobacteriota bacterium]